MRIIWFFLICIFFLFVIFFFVFWPTVYLLKNDIFQLLIKLSNQFTRPAHQEFYKLCLACFRYNMQGHPSLFRLFNETPSFGWGQRYRSPKVDKLYQRISHKTYNCRKLKVCDGNPHLLIPLFFRINAEFLSGVTKVIDDTELEYSYHLNRQWFCRTSLN